MKSVRETASQSGAVLVCLMICCLISIVASALFVLAFSGGAGVKISIDESAGRAEVRRMGKVLLAYRFASNQFKPYVKELTGLAGGNVLLDAPADHPHHHGLMYAIRVNGINFWEELPDSGRQRHVSFLSREASGGQARLVELVHWLGPGSIEPLLIEERSLGLTVHAASRELALRWRSKFRVGGDKVKLHGSAYNGLGLRLPEAWNGAARHRNSENLPYSAEHQWDVMPGKWAAVTRSGEEAQTVVLFGSPGNRGESRFFSMNNPFAYVSATQNLELVPIEYGPGETFELDYLLLLCDEERSPEQIRKRGQEWLKER